MGFPSVFIYQRRSDRIDRGDLHRGCPEIRSTWERHKKTTWLIIPPEPYDRNSGVIRPRQRLGGVPGYWKQSIDQR